MSEQLTIEQAVRSGKDFRCVETGEVFKNNPHSKFFYDSNGNMVSLYRSMFDQTFEIIEVKERINCK
jgi:hypothetical protein